MKSFRLLLTFVSVAFLFALGASTATAGSMGNGAAQRMKLVVNAVDVAAGTVEFKSMVDQTTHTYKIDSTTKIRIFGTSNMAGVKPTIDQIKVGEKVENYALGGEPAPQVLTFLMLSQAVVPVQ
jgi:hypothetical protein